ncbi:MAG: NAD(P)H-hydrate dehydratase, partial [Bacteroidales bacterium]
MKIFRSEQIKDIDRYTIANEPVASVDLMERAASQLLLWYARQFDRSRRVFVFAGPGNNGGDGLALARLLSANRFNPEVHYVKFTEKTSGDWNINRGRLEIETPVRFYELDDIKQFPLVTSDDVVIDAIFGSGLARPVEGLAAEVIGKINRSGATIVSVDIPSGLFGEDNSNNNPDAIIRAAYTLSFEFPKLSFLVADNAIFTGEWSVLPIGLSSAAIRNTATPFSYTGQDFIRSIIRKRNKFDHKGIYGHGLLVSGSYGKMGSAFLGAKAALRTGIGLLTCHIPSLGIDIIQTAIPEAMVSVDALEKMISDVGDIARFDAVAIGPGIGQDPVTQQALHSLLLNRNKAMVIDADGLNILGLNKKWLSALPGNAILTPHPKEFERIAGRTGNGFARLMRQIEFAAEYDSVVVLKGANTSVATPAGEVFFNSTGNPGMATAGSGDALTGIILSLLAQGYTPENAAVAGVYLHGLAGDIAAARSGQESIIASDIIDNIGNAFLKIRSGETD